MKYQMSYRRVLETIKKESKGQSIDRFVNVAL